MLRYGYITMSETTFDDVPEPSENERLKALFEQIMQGQIPDMPDEPLQDADANEELLASTAKPKPTVRGRVLRTADQYVNGDRNAQYGDPTADFQRTASYWQVYLYSIVERENGMFRLTPKDVAAMMALLKISRLSWSPEKADHWVDLAGYAACGAECAEKEKGLAW